jgi:hypothetical protein
LTQRVPPGGGTDSHSVTDFQRAPRLDMPLERKEAICRREPWLSSDCLA